MIAWGGTWGQQHLREQSTPRTLVLELRPTTVMVPSGRKLQRVLDQVSAGVVSDGDEYASDSARSDYGSVLQVLDLEAGDLVLRR